MKYTFLFKQGLGFIIMLLGAWPIWAASELRIGISADYPPFEYQEQGQLAGFDVDLGQAIGEALNRPVKWREMSFVSLVPALQSKQIDMILSSLSITSLRERYVAFSRVYFNSQPVLLSKKEHRDQGQGMRLGVQLGSTMEQIAKQRLKGATVVALSSNNQILEEIKMNRLDGIVLEKAQAEVFMKYYPSLQAYAITMPKDELPAQRGYAMAFRLGDPLCQQVNQVLEILEQNGTMQALRQKWFSS